MTNFIKKVLQKRYMRYAVLPGFVLMVLLLLLHLRNDQLLKMKAFDESAKTIVARSHHIAEQAGPAYQGKALDTLPPNPKNGTFYRLDDLLTKAAVLEKPSASFDKKKGGIRFSFEFDDSAKPGLGSVHGKTTCQVKDGILRIDYHDDDYLTNNVPIQIPNEDIGEIAIRARVTKGKRMVLAWHTKIQPKKEDIWYKRIDIDLIDNSEFHTYLINAKNAFKRGLGPRDKIRKIFLRPSDADGAVAEIDFIRFVTKQAKYEEHPRGVDYESLGKEMRRVLYMLPTQTLEYSLKVPEKSPTLDFGNGVLLDHKPVDFEITLSQNHTSQKIYSRKIDTSAGWHDARLDLSQWAGQQVKLSLRVTGSQDNVAFWSNPLIFSDPPEHFNVILILEDALRRDHLSAYGYGLSTSPNKDKLFAKKGVLFLNAFSHATWTRASVPTLMTSLLSTATGVWHWSDVLSDDYLTLAEVMRRQGFVTASFIQNENAGPNSGLHQGFSQILDMEILGGDTEGIFGKPLNRWLEKHRRQNFFLYLHVRDPHGPYEPPPPFDDWYRHTPSGGKHVKRMYLDPEWVKHPTLQGRRNRYDGEIRHNDSQLPGFIHRLSELGISSNTLLIFISDHGEHLGEHNLWDHRPPGYQEVIGVPLVLVYPGRFPQSKRIHEPVQLIDVMPTILDMAGVDIKKLALEGDSLVGLIEGQRPAYWKNRIIVSEEPYAMIEADPTGCGSLIFHHWQMISSKSLWRGSKFLPPILRTRIFDLKQDREEIGMTYSLVPDLLTKDKLLTVLCKVQSNDINAWKKWSSAGHEKAFKLDPDAQRRLKALGYIN
jgi:arylsulfatase A-like enzyme